MRILLVLLLLASLSSHWAMGQGTLTGIVRDSQTQKPLELAGVFLANTTRGASTDAEGKFALREVPPGRYTLVVSYLGYQLLTLPIVVAEVPQTFELLLVPSANQLGEVVVRPGRNRPADYALFKQLFLGTSSFARQCRIRNPDGVAVEYDTKTDVLTAFTPYQLQVDNEALGYRLTFYDLDFRSDFNKSTTRTNSQVVFEELPARNDRQQRRWAQHRQQAYLGSFTHFLRSVYHQQAEAEGFRVQSLRLQLNQRRAWADTFLLNHSTLGHRALPVQVTRYLQEPRETPLLSANPLPPDSLGRWQKMPARAWLRFPALLFVTYLPEAPDPAYLRNSAHRTTPVQQSILHLRAPEAEIAPDGTLVVPHTIATEGYWGFEKVGELLPQDYTPPPFGQKP